MRDNITSREKRTATTEDSLDKSKRRRKKRLLLVEPSFEEERAANMLPTCNSIHSTTVTATNWNHQSKQALDYIQETDASFKRNPQVSYVIATGKMKQQQSRWTSGDNSDSGGGSDGDHGTSSSSCGRSSIGNGRMIKNGRENGNSRDRKNQLASLLTILFGAILLAQMHQTTATPAVATTISQSSTSTTLVPRQAQARATTATTIANSPTESLFNSATTTHKPNMAATPSLNGSEVAARQPHRAAASVVLRPNAFIRHEHNGKDNSTTPMTPSTPTAKTSAMTDERASRLVSTTEPPKAALLGEDEDEEGNRVHKSTVMPTTIDDTAEDEFANESDGLTSEKSNNRLGSLIVDAAGEAADKLVGRLRGSSSDESIGSDIEGDGGGAAVEGEEGEGEGDEETIDSKAPIEVNESDKSSASAAESDVERRVGSGGGGSSVSLVVGQSNGAKKRQTSELASDSISSSLKVESGAGVRDGNNRNNSDKAELKFALDTYAKWRAAGDDIIELFSKKMLPLIVENGYDVDAVTVTGILQVFNAIRALKPWALKIIDASAKITPGLLVGTQSDFGDFDECTNVRVDDPSGLNLADEQVDEVTGLKSSTVVGRYCLADVEFPKPPRIRLANRNEELNTDFAPIELRRPLLNFSETAAFKDTIFVETGNFFHMLYVDPMRVGVCLTNKVDPDSFAKVFNKIIEDFRVTIDFKGRCVTKYDKPIWTIQQRVSAYVLAITCLLVLISTLLDVFHLKLNKLPLPESLHSWRVRTRCALFKYRPIFSSFSIIRNTKRLFKSQASERHNNSKSSNCSSSNYDCDERNSNCSKLTSNCFDSPRLVGKAVGSVSLVGSSQDSTSSESSPSIERRSSVTGSAVNLICEPSGCKSNQDKQVGHRLAHFVDPSISGIPSLKNNQSAHSPAAHTQTNLNCLHGIRVITMTWMIVNHTYLFGGFFVLWAHRRLIDIAEWPRSLSFQLVLNGWLTVETYFFLSAAIVVLNVMPLFKARKFAYLSYIVHRLFRLLPAYTGLVCLNFLWPLVSSGPVWMVKGKSFIQTPCENYLWTNFLFINNWIWPEKQCMVHTWFLSADFQLYLLAPVIVYLLYRRPVLGHSLNVIVAIVASAFSGFVIYANKLTPSTLINKLEFDSIKQQLSYSYFATYQHMGPYCLGIFTGYLLHKRPQINLPKHITWLLWLLLPPLSFTTLLLTYLWNGAYDEPSLINPSPLVSAVYVAIHRTIWTSLVAWIVFACATNRAKLMSSFLSHHLFVPLSRLSFSIYLVHLPVIMFRALNLRHTIEWTDTNILWEACGNFVVSLIAGYFVNIAFESPIINLERALFGCKPSTKSECHRHSGGKQDGGVSKTRNVLQKQQQPNNVSPVASKTSSIDNYSSGDESKSPESSASDTRKLSSSSAGSSSEPNSELLTRNQSTWNDNEPMRKSLQPKQGSSVERIFGNQMEPLESNLTKNITGNLANQISPQTNSKQEVSVRPNGSYQRQAHGAGSLILEQSGPTAIRRYSSYEPSTEIGDLYSPLALNEYQHYARAGFHLQMANNRQHQHRQDPASRLVQYATLARTSRFGQRQETFDYLNQAEPSNSTSHSQSISREPHASTMLEQEILSQSSRQQQLMQSRANPNNHQNLRQGRYGTLIGGGAREWRQRYGGENEHLHYREGTNDTEFNWRARAVDLADSCQMAGNWIQPGTLIPRIDSSTLRRVPKRGPNGAAESIVEEPAHGEGQ